MIIENCKYFRTPDSIKDESIIATIDGVKSFVPIDPDKFDSKGNRIYQGNNHYIEIMKQVDAGKLTIEEAD